MARTLKMKGWAGLCILTLLFLFFIHINFQDNTKSIKENKLSTTTKKLTTGESYNRLTLAHEQLLNSALAHIRLGYVANRTPDYSTPPLIILYNSHQQHQQWTLDDVLLNITNAYYFSMLQTGSAFAYDMTWPIKIEWFFEALPSYMAMSTDQAKYYKEKTEPHEIIYHPHNFNEGELSETNFLENYTNQGIKIVSTTQWIRNAWMLLRENPFMKATRDKYRLNHLVQKSDWFWLTNRLLFSVQKGSWFESQLEPYRDIMGGKLQYTESLSLFNPQTRKVTQEFSSKQWLRIGLRVDTSTTQQDIQCLISHVVNICQRQQEDLRCHVFISAPNRQLLNTLRNNMAKYRKQIAVHAVAEGFGFHDLENSKDHSIFDTDENRLKKDYARTFMDWIILTRMDYLVGQQNDHYLKTAAWAAQVQTDVNVENYTTENRCRIIPMSDW
jgi:hypothetical protein